MSTEKKPNKVFKGGAISPDFIASSIAKHQTKTTIGAHDIFLGQVRADEIDGQTVQAIEYSAYEEAAEKIFQEIREATFEKFELTCMHIYHSLGIVKTGEICLFVFVSAAHRKEAFEGIRYCVEEIKAKVPVFGKELLGEDAFSWKVNT